MEIDEFLALVKRRRSIRKFKPDPIPDEYVERILEAGRWAMSGANGQPWEFVVVKDQATKDKLGDALDEEMKLAAAIESSRVKEMRQPQMRDIPDVIPGSEWKNAPVVIALCADPRTAQASVLSRLFDDRWIIPENMGHVAQIIHLAAAACGLGSQWVTVSRLPEELIKPILGVPTILRILSLVPIGYPAYQPKPTFRRELREIVHYERYDMSRARSNEDVQEFIRSLREHSRPAYPIYKQADSSLRE
ncbi:MAG: nitroreductase family protein [Chloroflexi bacterium]|nr:nitroreductase family protein [Chloroflexota bacterium]